MTNSSDRGDLLALYAAYNAAIDDGDGNLFAQMWTQDGIFDHPVAQHAGRPALAEFVRSRQRGLESHPLIHHAHWNREIEFERRSQTDVSGRCLLVVTGQDPNSGEVRVVTSGEYRDRLRRVDGRWMFARRVLEVGGRRLK